MYGIFLMISEEGENERQSMCVSKVYKCTNKYIHIFCLSQMQWDLKPHIHITIKYIMCMYENRSQLNNNL